MMQTAHFAHWPPGLPRHLTLPQTNLFYNVEVVAKRYPDKPFLVFYDTRVTFKQFLREAERIAGYLQHECGVRKGDRVLLYMQNSPQWVMAYYGILRADAVVVPVNPMNRLDELAHYVGDSGAAVAIAGQELLPHVQPHVRAPGSAEGGLRHLVVAAYSDWLVEATDFDVPEVVKAPAVELAWPGVVSWQEAISRAQAPSAMTAGPDDMCVLPYTSGTTGKPKGCVHTHRSVMRTAVGSGHWFRYTQDSVMLAVLPFFHVTGMASAMNGPLFTGSTIVVLTRWDRDVALKCIERYRVTDWQAITTMVIDFLANPKLNSADLSSLNGVRGGGAAMPAALYAKLKTLTGLDYVEGYGLSETMAATHTNPPHRPKQQCLGIPSLDVDSRIVDPTTLQELPPGESGEIIVHGAQVMREYWRQPEATNESFIEIDGKRFFRTGDLGRVDEEGYFFMTDRLKRMINASGFKVWPAEVEAILYQHPAVQEACIIGAYDPRRGETVKALVILKPEQQGQVAEGDFIAWCHEQMAAYKAPRLVEFVDALPKSASGKVMWRQLQELQDARDRAIEDQQT